MASDNDLPVINPPFGRRRSDLGEWAYDHSAGLLTTVIVMLSLAIIFVSSQIIVGRRAALQSYMIELVSDPTPEPERPEAQRRDYGGDLGPALNRISNLAATAMGEGARNMSISGDAELDRQAQRAGEASDANREAYERGMREVNAIGHGAAGGSSSAAADARHADTRVKGRVTVSFSLVNPLRTAVNLYIPAYRCQGGGEVAVNIVVNRNGNVTSAAVDRSQSSSDACLTEMAVTAAYASRFNLDPSAPESQKGTIYYIFIAQ